MPNEANFKVLQQLKKELERRFKFALDTPLNIDWETTFQFFLRIHDYIELTINSSTLHKLVHKTEEIYYSTNELKILQDYGEPVSEIPLAPLSVYSEYSRLWMCYQCIEIIKTGDYVFPKGNAGIFHIVRDMRRLKDKKVPARNHFINHIERWKPMLEQLHNYFLKELGTLELVETSGMPVKKTEKLTLDLAAKLGITKETKWSEITWQFQNGFDVLLSCGSKKYKTNHEELGFLDSRSKCDKPKKSWNFLTNLSINKGEFLVKDYSPEQRENLAKDKQYIDKQFQKLFGISGDPFETFNEEKAIHKIKITMIPEKDFRPNYLDRNIFTDDEFSA